MELSRVKQKVKRDLAITEKKLDDPKIILAPGSVRYWQREQKKIRIVKSYLDKL